MQAASPSIWPSSSPPPWEDQRIRDGMAAQLELRRKLLAEGQKPLGWKLAFGGPAAMQRLRINAPLVGFLTDRALIESGGQVVISSWTKAAAEPELAVYLGRDLPADTNREMIQTAITAIGPAIELADVDHPSDDVSGTLAGGIYQRHVILGRRDTSRAGGQQEHLRCKVCRNGLEVVNTTELDALTGELISIVQHTANLLGHFGEALQAGQLIIAGSITPPFWVAPGEDFAFELEPIDTISVSFT